MRWDSVVVGWLARLNADAALTQALGGSHVYPAQASKPVRIPSVEYLIAYDTEGEWTNRIGFQVDYWATGVHQAKTIERRLRRLTHYDTAQYLDGERLWFRYVNGRTVEYTAAPGVVHRILDFECECVREKYAA